MRGSWRRARAPRRACSRPAPPGTTSPTSTSRRPSTASGCVATRRTTSPSTAFTRAARAMATATPPRAQRCSRRGIADETASSARGDRSVRLRPSHVRPQPDAGARFVPGAAFDPRPAAPAARRDGAALRAVRGHRVAHRGLPRRATTGSRRQRRGARALPRRPAGRAGVGVGGRGDVGDPARRRAAGLAGACVARRALAGGVVLKAPQRLRSLLEEGLIDGVVRQLMSGKEAMVFVVRCGDETRCAKVYKEADKRGFRQAVDYTENRKTKNTRQARAMAKGTRFGRKSAEDAWQNAEVDALFRLAAAGVRV